MSSSTNIKPQQSILSSSEKRSAYSLAGIYALRMLGLFMILPVFSLYAQKLEHSTPMLIGIAIGAYGLTQALFQIPYGYLSDRVGRKPMIIAGMLIFALGSIIAAQATDIYGVIIGRLLQGSGAVAAVLMAFAADLTREEHRLKVMAIIGMSIGFSFGIAMVLGSLLEQWIGVNGIFLLTAVLALLAIVIVVFVVPNPEQIKHHRDTEAEPAKLLKMLKDPQLFRLDLGIFILHMVLTATFLVIPLSLTQENIGNLMLNEHWKVYLPTIFLSMILMVPFIIIAETKRKMKAVFIGAIFVLSLTELCFYFFSYSAISIAVILLIFFTAFNLLEASLPSLVAKISPAENKGTAMGVYSTSQFLGAFSGGVFGGLVMDFGGMQSVYLFAVICLLSWLLIAVTMKSPRYLSNFIVKVSNAKSEDIIHLTQMLTEVNGVAEAVIDLEVGEAFLKVDLHALDRDKLLQVSNQYC
ncbi:MAG: MFS transporter [Gammaproteobacteria bacterium]|nr:MFS transporter [Gammaproteobacteria bacterium]